MKVLFLTPQVPYPPHKGTSLRNFHLIRGAAARHEVHLLSFAEPGGSASDFPTLSGSRCVGTSRAEVRNTQVSFDHPLGMTGKSSASPLKELCTTIRTIPLPHRPFSSRLASFLLSRSPDVATRLSSGDFAAKLDRALSSLRPDIVQVEGLELARYVLSRRPFGPGTALVLDEHNAEYVLQRRAFEVDRGAPRRWPAALYSLVQWQKLTRYERMACRRANAVIAVSVEDRRALLRLDPRLDIAVVPNGVDCAYFQKQERRQTGATLVFTGTMDFRPNVDAVAWFVRDILPLIKEQAPEARFVIVGGSPSPGVAALAGPSVEVTGFVPDVRPHLGRAAVYVIPMRMGGGVRFKALEAMASGVPVVSTTMGIEGISVTGEEELLLADDAPSFAAAVVRLLRDPALGQRMADKARRLAEERYDWSRITPRLNELYEKLGMEIKRRRRELEPQMDTDEHR